MQQPCSTGNVIKDMNEIVISKKYYTLFDKVVIFEFQNVLYVVYDSV